MDQITEIHNRSIELGNQFAAAYRRDRSSEETTDLLEQYRDTRRELPFRWDGSRSRRPGSGEAFYATQGRYLES